MTTELAKRILQGIALTICLAHNGAFAGAVYGPREATVTVQPLTTQPFQPILFRGGELAVISVSGNGATILDAYVYDSAGNLVDKDEDGYIDCVVMFRPLRSGYYSVRVVNRGRRLPNTFVLATN